MSWRPVAPAHCTGAAEGLALGGPVVSRTRLGLSLLSTLLVSSSPAFGWADVGHQVVCEIAFQELTGAVKKAVERLVETHPDFSTFPEACTWPDRPGGERKDEHYNNVSRDSDQIRTEACHMADRCLFTAIRKDSGEVSDESRSDQERAEALAYLGHWIGDLHQPLHVAFKDDKGGNDVQESGSACSGNLHLVWDLCIIDRMLGSDSRAIARSLHGEITSSDRDEWLDSTVVGWADESYEITISQQVGYCVKEGGACWYEANRARLDPTAAKKTVPVDQTYIDVQLPIVRKRLQKAGIRLGGLLNDLFGRTGTRIEP